jgi:hypothetical protein
MDDHDPGIFLLSRIDAHCREHGIEEQRFGYLAVGDGRFVSRLRDGKATLHLMRRAIAYLESPAASASARARGRPAQHQDAA